VRSAVIAQQVVDLPEDHLRLRAPCGISKLVVSIERLCNQNTTLSRLREIARDLPKKSQRRCLALSVASEGERSTGVFSFRARLLYLAHVSKRFRSPKSSLGSVRTVEVPLEES
jgi:hypothetical protein